MKRKKLILIPLLIISLMVFNFPVYAVLAENTSIETGNAEAEIGIINETNTNIADLGKQDENNNDNGGEDALDSQTATTTDNLNIETADGLLGETPGAFVVTTTPQVLATSSPETLATTTADNLASTTDKIIKGNPQTESLSFENVVIQNNNEATTTTEVNGGAITGLNSSNLNGNDASIKTGDATATANITNVSNTNITGSNFWFLLSNFFYNLTGNLYLGDFSANQNNNCGIIDCVNSLDVENNNNGTIVNDVEVYALTGFNSASANFGNAEIETGNAQVTANVFNLLNTNITGSDWFFGIFNNFGDWTGNFVFPGNGAVENFISGGGNIGVSSTPEILSENNGAENINIKNNGQAEVENNVNVTAETGDNSANDNWGGSSIETGEAKAAANISNAVNTNIFGNNWLMIAIKVFGDWSGNIFSLPPGISWTKTADGVILYSSDLINNFLNGNGNNSEQEGNSDIGSAETSSLNVKSNNIAKIVNNLNLFASTGGNSANYNAGSGSIKTGNASAAANISNFVNTNIVGRNWLLASINVFGSWRGNLAFGQPDLWLGQSATTSEKKINRASYFTYTLSYANNGDAEATDVVLIGEYDNRYLGIADAGAGEASAPGKIQWNIGSVPINGSGSVSYALFIKDETPYGGTYLTNSSLIKSHEDDRNNIDNKDILTVLANLDPPMGWSGPPKLPYIEVNKTNDAESFVYPGDIVNYKIVAANKGVGSAYNVVLADTLKNESLEVIKTQSWELGEILPNEEITIEYSLLINGGIDPGVYVNAVEIQGKDINDRNISILSGQIDSVIKVKEKEKNNNKEANKQIKETPVIKNIEKEIKEEIKIPPTLKSEKETETALPIKELSSTTSTEPVQKKERTEEYIKSPGPLSLIASAEAAKNDKADLNEKISKEEPNKTALENFGQSLLAGIANLWQNKLLIYLLTLTALGFLSLGYLKFRGKIFIFKKWKR